MEKGFGAMNKKEKKLLKEAIKICSQYNWHDEVSMRWTLERTKDFLIDNFDLEEK